jgi:hypothetical protein
MDLHNQKKLRKKLLNKNNNSSIWLIVTLRILIIQLIETECQTFQESWLKTTKKQINLDSKLDQD